MISYIVLVQPKSNVVDNDLQKELAKFKQLCSSQIGIISASTGHNASQDYAYGCTAHVIDQDCLRTFLHHPQYQAWEEQMRQLCLEIVTYDFDDVLPQRQEPKKSERPVEERLEAVIEDVAVFIEKPKIFPGTSYFNDLEMDAIDFVELIYALEEEFGFKIPSEDAEQLLTVGDTLAYLTQRLSFQQIKTEQQYKTIIERLQSIVREQLKLENNVSTTASWVEDLNAGVVDLLNLYFAIQDEFKVNIPDEDFEKMLSIAATEEWLVQKGGVR